MLERDRRLTESELTKVFPGQRLTGKLVLLHSQALRMPTNPTRVDRLIWDNFREHARITDLARKMEKHSGISKQVWPLNLFIDLFFPGFCCACTPALATSGKQMTPFKVLLDLIQAMRKQR